MFHGMMLGLVSDHITIIIIDLFGLEHQQPKTFVPNISPSHELAQLVRVFKEG